MAGKTRREREGRDSGRKRGRRREPREKWKTEKTGIGRMPGDPQVRVVQDRNTRTGETRRRGYLAKDVAADPEGAWLASRWEHGDRGAIAEVHRRRAEIVRQDLERRQAEKAERRERRAARRAGAASGAQRAGRGARKAAARVFRGSGDPIIKPGMDPNQFNERQAPRPRRQWKPPWRKDQ